MPINFPNSPSLNQQYTYDNKTWEWNGIYWEVYSALTSYITSAYTSGDGYSSISGVTGGNIVLKSFSGINITIIDGGDKLTFSSSTTSSSVSGNYLPLSGGTVTGNTIFQSGLTANTVSATTYQNLPVSGLTGSSGISVTGNSNGNFTISYTGSTGASGDFLPLSGGTVTGDTVFQSGLTATTISATTISATTISATTYKNFPINIVSSTCVVPNDGSLYFGSNSGGWSYYNWDAQIYGGNLNYSDSFFGIPIPFDILIGSRISLSGIAFSNATTKIVDDVFEFHLFYFSCDDFRYNEIGSGVFNFDNLGILCFGDTFTLANDLMSCCNFLLVSFGITTQASDGTSIKISFKITN